MKKLTKILPLAMALMLAAPAFAAEGDIGNAGNNKTFDSSELSLTLPHFISITKKATSSETATAEFDGNYTTLTPKPQLHSDFHVITNVPNKKIYLKGTCPVGASELPALFADGFSDHTSTLNLVFANTTVSPDEDDVNHLTGGGIDPKSSANAVAFTLSPNFTFDQEETGAAVTASAFDSTKGVVTYTIQNGIYDIVYTLGTSATPGTFSTKDTFGLYKATLLLTDAQP